MLLVSTNWLLAQCGHTVLGSLTPHCTCYLTAGRCRYLGLSGAAWPVLESNIRHSVSRLSSKRYQTVSRGNSLLPDYCLPIIAWLMSPCSTALHCMLQSCWDTSFALLSHSYVLGQIVNHFVIMLNLPSSHSFLKSFYFGLWVKVFYALITFTRRHGRQRENFRHLAFLLAVQDRYFSGVRSVQGSMVFYALLWHHNEEHQGHGNNTAGIKFNTYALPCSVLPCPTISILLASANDSLIHAWHIQICAMLTKLHNRQPHHCRTLFTRSYCNITVALSWYCYMFQQWLYVINWKCPSPS